MTIRRLACAACCALALAHQASAFGVTSLRCRSLQSRRTAAAAGTAVNLSRGLSMHTPPNAAAPAQQQAPKAFVAEADPIAFVRLLGQLTPPPAENSSPEDEEAMVAGAVREHLDEVLDGPFLRWIQKKLELSETMGNKAAHATLRTLERAIAAAITDKLRPATELVTALLGSDCSGARGQLLREILVLPGGEAHPLWLAPGDPKRQFGEPAVDPFDFKRAWDVLAEGHRLRGVWEDSADTQGTRHMMETVLGECAKVLNGEADVKSDEEVSSCSTKV